MVGNSGTDIHDQMVGVSRTAALDDSLSRTERRRRITHGQLLEAARELVLERGVGGYTVSDLADAADLGVGTVYNHFDDWRDGPLAEMASRVLDEWEAEIDIQLENQPSAAGAAVVLVQLLSQAPMGGWSEPRLVDLLVRTDQWPRARVLELAQRIIEAGIGDDSMRADIDAPVVAAALVGIAVQVTDLALHDTAPASEDISAIVCRICGVDELQIDPPIELH